MSATTVTPRGGFLSDWLNFQLTCCLLVIAAAAASTLFIESNYMIQILVLTTIYAMVGVAWAIAGGLSGLLLLGFISFFGIGAYVNGLLFTKFGISPWLNLPIAGLAAGLLAAGIAGLTLRFGLNEDYFAMFTVALSQVIKYIFLNWDWAGRATGIYITIIHDDPVNMAFVDRQPYLFIALGLLLFVILVNYCIQRSRMGYFLVAVRENPQAAEALGINETRAKTFAIVVAGALGGVAGAFYCQYATFIDPLQVFSLTKNFELLLGPVLGGRTTLLGPVLGASLIKPLQDLLRGVMGGHADALYLVIYGAILIVGILFMPRGIARFIQNWHARFFVRRR